MGVNVTTRTVWFAVCQECTRLHIAAGGKQFSAVSFDSHQARSEWRVKHTLGNAPTHRIDDYAVWDVTAGDPVA
jgi:hypothetical protein